MWTQENFTEWVLGHSAWDFLIFGLAFVLTALWGFLSRLRGPLWFLLALVATFLVLLTVRVFGTVGEVVLAIPFGIALWRILSEKKHGLLGRQAPVQQGHPTSTYLDGHAGYAKSGRTGSFTIRFDFLPGDPLKNGWAWRYPRPQPPDYINHLKCSRPDDLHADDGLRIVCDLPFYAIGYDLALTGPPFDQMEYDIKYSGDTMVFILVDVASKDGKLAGEKWIKIHASRDGSVRAEVTKEYPNEFTLWVPGRPLRDGWLQFNLSLPEVMKVTWARDGWTFKRVKMFSLRGSLSISPIGFGCPDLGGLHRCLLNATAAILRPRTSQRKNARSEHRAVASARSPWHDHRYRGRGAR